MTAAAFFVAALPFAQQAHAQTGLATSVVLAQWADETAYGGYDWSVAHNPGNVGSYDGEPVATFPTLQAGVDAYIYKPFTPDELHRKLEHLVGSVTRKRSGGFFSRLLGGH